MASKGLDPGDKVLAKAVAAQLIHQLRMQASRGKILRDGKKGTAPGWRLPEKGCSQEEYCVPQKVPNLSPDIHLRYMHARTFQRTA